MAPEELIDPVAPCIITTTMTRPGLTWLRRIQEHFRAGIWLNPLPEGQWNRTTHQPRAPGVSDV
jgi:uncharacterized protein with von Willebrand factor type A (vWA) domain